MRMIDFRRTRAWRKLRDQVVEEEPDCRLAYPDVCTGASETAAHARGETPGPARPRALDIFKPL
jgi:hypothetical protein